MNNPAIIKVSSHYRIVTIMQAFLLLVGGLVLDGGDLGRGLLLSCLLFHATALGLGILRRFRKSERDAWDVVMVYLGFPVCHVVVMGLWPYCRGLHSVGYLG